MYAIHDTAVACSSLPCHTASELYTQTTIMVQCFALKTAYAFSRLAVYTLRNIPIKRGCSKRLAATSCCARLAADCRKNCFPPSPKSFVDSIVTKQIYLIVPIHAYSNARHQLHLYRAAKSSYNAIFSELAAQAKNEGKVGGGAGNPRRATVAARPRYTMPGNERDKSSGSRSTLVVPRNSRSLIPIRGR